MSGISTANSYESLTDESIELHIVNEAIKRKNPNKNLIKVIKPPPLTVYNMSISEVENDLANLGLQGHEIKITNYGTKIYTFTTDH